MRKRLLKMLCMWLYVILPAVAFSQTTYYVSTGGSDANNGLTPGTSKQTINGAISAAVTPAVILVAAGNFSENVVINKSNITIAGVGSGANGKLIPATVSSVLHTVITGPVTGKGVQVSGAQTNITVRDLAIVGYTEEGFHALANCNNLTLKRLQVNNNGGLSGILIGGPVVNVIIDSVAAVNNTGRAIAIWDNFKQNITITHNYVSIGGCCGIDLNDGTSSGVNISDNTVVAGTGSSDSGIGILGLTKGAGPNIIANNTISVAKRYGIEIKNPAGSGSENEMSDGAIVVRNNTITRTGAQAETRDIAGIAVFRRSFTGGNPSGYVDVPGGVVIKDNIITGFTQANGTSGSEGFGIVAEGVRILIKNNTISNCEIGIQRQAGNPSGYVKNDAGDANQATDDTYFNRGNSPFSANIIATGNTLTTNGTNARDVFAANSYMGDSNYVFNFSKKINFATISLGVEYSAAGDTLNASNATFTEMVTINKALTLNGVSNTMSVLTYDGIASTSVIPTLIKVTAQNVTINNFGFIVNFNRLHSAIHTSGNTAGLKITNNKITGTRTSTSNIGAYGTRNAIVLNRISLPYGTYAADYTNIPSGFADLTVTGNTVAGTTTAQNTFADAYFRAAIDMDLLGNVEISGNNLQAINHDVSYRFGNNGKVWIRNNIFNGGGIEHTELNGGADSTIISNNVFNNAPITDPTISLLRLKNNTADKPVLVQKNTFNNAFWYIAVENFRNLVIDSNTFTGAGTNAKLVTVNTKTTATSTVANVNLSVTLTRNTFNVGTATNATALGFYNHKNDPANYGTFVLGTSGNENRFGTGFTNFIYLDTNNATPTRVATTPLAGFPEYGGSIAISTTGYWTANMRADQNFYNLGAGPVKATAMSPAQRATLETRLFHKVDNNNVGLLETYFPVQNVNTGNLYASIQSAIDSATAGDTIKLDTVTFTEMVVINKALTLQGTTDSTTILTYDAVPSTSVIPTLIKVTAQNVTIKNIGFKVNFNRLHSAIHTSGNTAGLKIMNNKITATRTSTSNIGAYGTRNAIVLNRISLPYGTYAADYTNMPSGFANVTVTGNTVAGTTTAQNTFADAYFRAAIDMDLLGNVEISGNNLQAINHDVSYRFGNNGKVWIRNNIFNGGGIEHTELNGGADSTIISNNVFNNAPITDPTISLLRLKNNTADKPVLVQKNTFNNAFWYIAVENFRNLVIDSNTFTGAGTNAKLVTVNTKTTATSTVANVNLSVTLTRNIFNVGTATNATALGFYNHKNDPANYGTFVLGINGNENRFGAGFTNFIYVDSNNGTPTRVGATALAGFPEYGGSIAISTTGYWTADLDAIHNFFNLGAGSVKATAMSPAQRAILETKIFHKIDNSNIGLVNTYFQSIPAISTINDTNIACPLSASSVVVNFTVADSQTPLDSLKLTAASSDTSVIRLTNIVFGGTGANRTATISAVNGKVGSSIITFKVKDEQSDSAMTSFVVTVADSTKPVVRTRNINAFLNASGTVTISYTQIDSSSSDNCTITSMRLSDSVFTCAKIGANMVRLIATDIAGNKDSAMAVVFVKDTIKPTVLGQNITRYLNASGTVTVNASDLNNGSTDAVCGGLTYSISKSTFNCSNRGLNAVRLIATDSSGNKDSVGVNINILDTLKPVAIAQSSILIYLTDSGKANITPAMVNNGSNDNCSIDSMWVTPSQVTCADKGVKKVTLHVRDLSGNTDTISVNALVTDPVAPVARAKAKVTAYLNINGQAVVNAAGLDSASTDNCSITSRVLSQSVFTCAERGNNNVILTVQDQSGNSATDTVIVEVRDTIKPNAFVQNQVIYLNSSGTATLNPASVNSGSSDNCGVDSIWISKTTFNASNLGNNIDTLIIRDASNNITKTTFIVTVSDSSKPTAIAQTTTAYLNAAGTVTVNAASVNNGSTDNSGAMTYSLSRSTFTCADIGSQNVSFTATDASNNSSTVPVTINVTDTIKPVISTQNIITYLDASGAATVTASQLNNNSTDNCSISQVTASKLNFTCVERGANNITLTVKDASNNSSTGNVVITVLDTMRPTAIAKSNISVYVDAAGNATLTTAMVNNGSFDNCFIASMNLSKTAFDKTNLGSNTITFTVTDSSGNVKAIPVVISVLDSIKPNAIAQNKTIYLGTTGVATITAAEVNNASTDNVGVKTVALSQTTFNCSNKGINVVILTVTDSSGNSDTAQATITVSDTTRPVLTAPLNNLTFGQCGAVVNYALPQASDNCASFTISQTNGLPSGSKFPAGVTTNTFVISDASNNSITVSFTVTISGGYLPVTFSNIEICASVPPFDLSQGKDSLVFEGNGIGLDRKTFDPSLAGSGNHRITYKYTDSTGCENSGTFFVTVFSSPEKPVIERKTANVLSVTNSYNSYQWYRDGQAINGENKQSIVVKQSGVYTVIVGTIRGCSGVSAAIGIGVPTGINTIDNRISYNVYPNPSSGKFVIEKGSNAKRTTIITVTDIVGKTITSISSDDDIVDMDLSTLAAGTYYLRLQNGDATSVKPIIIK